MDEKLLYEKQLVKGKIQRSKGAFFGPIRALRASLGLSQEAAARKIGVALKTWYAWESGLQQPRRTQLEAIANLIKDPALRMKFWLDIYSEGIKLGVPAGKAMTQRDALILRYGNDAIEAIKELCLGAAEGSTASEEALRDLADRLVRAAGNTRRLLDAAPKPRGK